MILRIRRGLHENRLRWNICVKRNQLHQHKLHRKGNSKRAEILMDKDSIVTDSNKKFFSIVY